MTTSQASRIFGIPYNSLLMYVRGKYGKSLKLEQLRKDCISGPPIELLQMGANKGSGQNGSSTGSGNNNTNKDHNHGGAQNTAKEFDGSMSGAAEVHGELLSSNPMFNPFPANFYPDFAGFPGLPLGMLNLLPQDGRQAASHLANLSMEEDDDCKSEERSKLSDDEFQGPGTQHMDLNRHEAHRAEMVLQSQE